MVKSIKDLNLTGKNVFIRVDFNVPIKNGVVSDDTRILEAVKTIRFALDSGAKVALASHLGRPKGEKNLEFSMKPVADYINKHKIFDVEFVSDCVGESVEKALSTLPKGTALLLENLRFYPGEEKNSAEFVQLLAKPFNVFINDAFGTCHRKHASTYGMAELIEDRAAGFLVEKEAKYFDTLIKNPERPFAAILGGAKVSDKIGVIDSLLNIADVILIGGAMAYTFLKYNGVSVGTSLVEAEQMNTVAEIYKKAKEKGVDILLPIDHIISDKFGGEPVASGSLCSVGSWAIKEGEVASPSVADEVNIPESFMGLDIGVKTAKLYGETLKQCKTILWNGPMGVFEQPAYAKGTFYIAETLANLGATVVVGGGDSVSAVKKANVADKISHISTGGGASLEYIEHGTLPGIDILR